METAPFVLVDLETEEGISGHAHVFCYLDIALPMIRRAIAAVGESLKGLSVDPDVVRQLGRGRFTLLGTPGVVGMALSALDVAFWDALARAANLPLGRYLGGEIQAIPVYNSNGLSLTEIDGLADEALALLEPGFEAVKIRLGRTDAADDLRAVRAVRAAIPTETAMLADFNQALSVDAAIRRGTVLKDEGLAWLEEPTAHDDLTGCARIAAALETPIQIGENFSGPSTLAAAIELNSLDYVMVDLMRIGGVSGWLQAANLAAKAGMPLSSHLYPEVSAHLLSASPTAHWLEYVEWAEPLITTPIEVSAGQAIVSVELGTGVIWDDAAVSRYSVD